MYSLSMALLSLNLVNDRNTEDLENNPIKGSEENWTFNLVNESRPKLEKEIRTERNNQSMKEHETRMFQ